jgi:hypothetical protein
MESWQRASESMIQLVALGIYAVRDAVQLLDELDLLFKQERPFLVRMTSVLQPRPEPCGLGW